VPGLTAAIAYTFLRWKPFRVEIEGPSMRPTLEPGDWALAVASPRVRPGSVVVVEHPARPGFEMVKRVIGVPGDRAPDGRVLGEDEYWVEGDASPASTDSRAFGPVPRALVKGTVLAVYRPAERRRLL
jgi:nickel-type superoxide dismutase maturation protease